MQQKTGRKPSITISETDHQRLTGLAEALEDRNPEASETMFAELDRARIVRDGTLAATIVRMGSTVVYTADEGQEKTVTLVYPGDADIEQGRISITTPVGTALIGLKEGQSINWTARNGQTHKLTVVRVSQPEETA
ncbi:nucleoside diphosphate kinase regulator [Nitratireductor sp. GISD-1A_MAKvit]|uniref:nucleoside diphosphate kinase regulator n=1 Tax=Nitratireductor sp. GISD-1A_MAKvit TaxID=3234198 RepID=UPI00346553A3